MAVGLGVLCTSNYEARKFGVRSAMPAYIAKKLCPELVVLPLNFPKYIDKGILHYR
jgi:DNA polymerase kappa